MRRSHTRLAGARALNEAAWFLLTASDEKLRDPRRALPMARKAVELTGEDDGSILDTLAKALHDTGDIRGAARYAKRAAEKEPDSEEIARRAEEYAKETAKSF